MSNIGDHRAVGSSASDTGRYRHSACTNTVTFEKGNILALCTNRSCPNKGANWVLEEKLESAELEMKKQQEEDEERKEKEEQQENDEETEGDSE
jgi:hypothetical protein